MSAVVDARKVRRQVWCRQRLAARPQSTLRGHAFDEWSVDAGADRFEELVALETSGMEEVEIIGTFDSEETARGVAKVLNAFFVWLMEGDRDEDVPEFFEDFGVSTEDFIIDEDDMDWPEAPRARVRGPKININVETGQTIDMFQELLESLGAFDVYTDDEDEDDDD